MIRYFRALSILVLSCLSACMGAIQPLSDADLSDPGIKARIEAKFAEHEQLDLRYVTIDVHARIVTISGMIENHADARLIRTLVTETRGVEQTVNNLVVR